MRTLFCIIVIVAIVVFIYISLNLVASRIGFNFSLKDIDFNTLNLSDLLTKGQTKLGLDINTIVTNLNIFNINFSFLEVWICHDSILIAKSSRVLQGKISIPGNSVTNFVLPLELYINPELVKVSVLLKLKQPVKIEYTVKLNLFGIPLRKYSNNYIINS